MRTARRSLIALCVFLVAAVVGATPATTLAAGPGSPDPTFAAGGKAQTNVNPNQVTSAVLQPDGKIVVIASLADFNVASQVFGVLRYLPSGALDPAFGSGGVVRTALTIGFNYPYAVAVQADGKIVVAGSASSPNNSTDAIAVARYNGDGSLDGSFGTGGKLTTVLLGFRDVAQTVVVQPNGKVLIGGLALTCFGRGCGHDTALVRYNANGSLDGTFGRGGSVVTASIGQVDALGLEGDGSILALDRQGIGTSPVARFDASGNPQPVALTGTLGPISSLYNATFQPDGKIVLGGGAAGLCRHGRSVQVTRRTLADSLDPQFNSPPFFFGSGQCNVADVAQAVAIASSGKIVVGGIAAMPNFQTAFGVARLNADGSLDQTWGTGGRVTSLFTGRADQVVAVAVQPDGKVVAVGLTATDNMGHTAVAVARYLG
jgi:uncharacterized delta-60 repeat protein